MMPSCEPVRLPAAPNKYSPRKHSAPTTSSRHANHPSEAILSQAFLELAPDAIVVADAAGHIVLVNHQTEVLFGCARPQLLGQGIERLLPERLRLAHERHRGDYVAAPHTRPMGSGLELFARRLDGSEFPVEVSLSPLRMGEELLVIAIVRDITERQALEAQARANMQARVHLLQAVLEALPCGVYLVRGHDARLVLANRAVETVWGMSWPEGEPLEAFLEASGVCLCDPHGLPLPYSQLATLQAVRCAKTCVQQEEVVRRPDGTAVPVLVSAFPLDPGLLLADARSQKPTGSQTTRAATSAGAASAATNEATCGSGRNEPAARLISVESLALVVHQDVSTLKDAERLKDEFIAIAAHELRNPMAAILGFAQMLAPRRAAQGESVLPLDWPELVEGVMEGTQRLVALTDDLLDATRLQAGRLELHLEPSDLVALARRVIRRLQPTTMAHALHLDTTRVSPASGEHVAEYVVAQIDVGRIEQVLTNLLQNAIKYSPDGGVITVAICERVEDGMAQLSVADEGIGIPVGEQPRLFGRFVRAANAREQGIAGTGLGLYLCRELVERHAGRIWVDSTEGCGTTFSVLLPLAAVED